ITVPTGDFVNISTKVTNLGLPYSNDEFILMRTETNGPGGSQIGPPLLFTPPLQPLGNNESHGPFSFTWEAPQIEGMYYFNISVDPFLNVTDMNLDNNSFILQFNVVQVFPDLYITPSDISFASQPYLGNPTTIYANVHANANRSVTSSFLVSFLSDGQLVGNDTLTSVPAGGSTNASVVWVPDVGPHTIRVEVDPLDFVGESDESNNSAEVVTSVPWPDLSPRDITVKDGTVYFYQDPQPVGYVSEVITTYVGQSHTISLNVTNFASSFYNTDFRVKFYQTSGLGGPQNQTAFYDSGSLSSLNAGQSHGPLASTWVVPAIAGNYFLNLTIDVDDTVPETSESNNTFILRFQVLAPDDVDYTPTTSMISPIQTSIGKQVNLTSRVENLGTTAASTSSTIVFYGQSNPSTLLLEDTVIALNGGATSPGSYGFDWIPPAVGTYVIVIQVDYYNDIPETDETNNNLLVTVEVFDLPVSTITVGTPKYGSDPVYVTSSSVFTLSAVDHSGQGIDRIMYRIGGGAWDNHLLTGDFTIAQEGATTIEYYAVDKIGGEEQTQSISVFVDDTPPVTTLEYAGELVRPSTDLELSATDEGSGVASRWYRVDDGDWIQYSIPFFMEEGSYTLEFYSIDNLGNTEEPTQMQLEVGLQDEATETNYKPILSVVLAIFLLVIGLLLSRREPESDEESGKAGFFTHFDMRSFVMFSVSFAAIEFIIGAVSAATGILSIPPTFGAGLIVDLIIFIVGLMLALWWNRKEKAKTPIVD
ncbi:MAG: CARDB domain-containing protein, partial [Thermoplasmata archaeon]